MGTERKGIFYSTSTGATPVEKWLNNQNPKIQAKILRYMELIEKHSDIGNFKFVKALGNGLFEFSLKIDKQWPRIIYFYFKDDQIVYLHGFLKKSNRTPANEIKIVKKRMNDFYKRKGNQ